MYHNIPLELRELRQWVCWRYEEKNGRMTKVPYAPNGQYHASIHNPATWGTFDEACNTALGPVMDGIGFVLTEHDPYTGIDIDDKLENPASEEERAMHVKILEAFQSYTERSVGGRGYHIIIRGKIPGGRDRGHVGVYSTQRYLTFSGDVVRNAPIAEYQDFLEELVRNMPQDTFAAELYEVEGILTDREVCEMALGAANADKYDRLCRGDVRFKSKGDPEPEYESPSEADLALISMLAFYTRDNEQVRRLFRMTALGKREKHIDSNKWIDRCLKIARDKQATPADFANAQANAERIVANMVPVSTEVPMPDGGPLVEHAAALAPPVPNVPARADGNMPPGLVGELAAYFYSTAIRPVWEAAVSGAIACVAGLVGRSYNISGTGLNQYMLFVATTGTGKEAIETGMTTLTNATRPSIPMIDQYVGPGAFASGQALVRVLDKSPCFVSVLGEFGITLQAVSDPRAPQAVLMLRKVLLDLYGKSGWNSVLRPTAYSDSEKNTKVVHAPAVTIMGECTPETFYDQITSSDIADGLIPRFHIVEYNGPRPKRNRHAFHPPSPELLQKYINLATVAITCNNNHTCAAVQIEPAALHMLDAFDEECDAHINSAHNAAEKQLWNRAHLKALKLAGLLAVGCNPHSPVVTEECAEWAVRFTKAGTAQVMHRFDMGDIGNGELKQQSEIRRVVGEYFKHDSKALAAYKVKPEYQKAGVLPYAYLTVRLARVACFYKDRRGGAAALKTALEQMVQTEVLGQVTPMDAQNKFQSRQALYYVGVNY